MKKFFKFLLKLILVVLIAWILLKVHNTYELKKIYDGMQAAENSEYFHRIINSTNASPNKQEVYAKDNKILLKDEYDDETVVEKTEVLQYVDDNEMYMSQTTKDGTSTLLISYGNGLGGGNKIYADSIPLVLIRYSFNVGTVLKNLITPTILYYGDYNGQECYIIKSPIDTTYISKETCLPVYTEMKEVKVNDLGLKYLSFLYPDVFGGMLMGSADDTVIDAWHTEHEYSLEKFDDSILDIPDFSKYTTVVLASSMSREGKAFDKTEKAISGTDLEVGERLITNIKLNDDEELDYYKRIGNSAIPNNSDELGKIDIFDIKVYNKVKEKAYNNLLELNIDDFVNYAVSIVYKEGYKLSFDEAINDEEQPYYYNYIVTSEPSDEPSVLLIIRPYTEVKYGNLESLNAVEKISEINIKPDEARKTADENMEDIKDTLGELLTNYELRADELVNIDFDNTKLNALMSNSPSGRITCWQLEYFAGNDKVMYVFVNANTGELIGAKFKDYIGSEPIEE